MKKVIKLTGALFFFALQIFLANMFVIHFKLLFFNFQHFIRLLTVLLIIFNLIV